LIVISHDVDLLEAVVNKVWNLDANRAALDVYNVGWKTYLQQRETDERRRHRERANAERKIETLRSQADKMRAKATKARAAHQMDRRAAALAAGLDEVRGPDKVARLRFPAPAPCGRTPLTAEGLSKSYGSLEVFTDVDLAVDRGARVVVLGLNGAGKTTLLRLLSGIEAPDTGTVVPGHGLRLGYYAQEHETLDHDRTILENMRTSASAAATHGRDSYTDTDLRKILGAFLFSGDDVQKPAGVLSGGEKTRLALAMLVTGAANVLLLDEPTNNLDPVSRGQVLDALRTYAGAIVLVTHDEGAVEALSPEKVILLPDGVEDIWSPELADLIALA
jgi:ATP-binding cassette subfamily F protein 3